MKKQKIAFTLAETLIALAVLGIVASITIPHVVRRQIEASNRVKIKKVMGVYDSFIQKAVIENDIKSEQAFRDWADSDKIDKPNCENSSNYFKVTEFLGESDGVNKKCEFANPDGVVLNITDPLNPVVAPSKKDYLKYKADNNYAKAYKFVVSFDKKSGAFRVNDLSYELSLAQSEQDEEKIEELEKLYAFLNNDEKVKVSDFMKNCTKIDDDNYSCGGTTFKKTPMSAWTYDGEDCEICKDFDCEEGRDTETCNKLKAESKAEGGEYYTANIGSNKTWYEAKEECENTYHGKVANVAQLQRMYKDGTLKCADGSRAHINNCHFWASEETSNGSFGVRFVPDYITHYFKDDGYQNLQVVCVGK